MKKILAAGITNEAVSAEDAMEQMIKEKNRVLQIGKSFVIKCTGENPVACLWDEAKI